MVNHQELHPRQAERRAEQGFLVPKVSSKVIEPRAPWCLPAHAGKAGAAALPQPVSTAPLPSTSMWSLWPLLTTLSSAMPRLGQTGGRRRTECPLTSAALPDVNYT